jgi:hypothetical protein
MQNFTKQIVEQFTANTKIIEKRKLATHIDIVTDKSLWDEISKPGIMHPMTKEICLLAFKHGGFIADGMARWALTSTMTAKERAAYVFNGGDIDLFFRTKQGWIDFLDEMCDESNVSYISNAKLSLGKLAIDLTLDNKENSNAKFTKLPTIQAIGCVFGTPQQVLSSFDFVNCMAAFDDKNSYYATNLLQLEKQKCLGVVSWQSRSTISRIQKYITKYGYQFGVDMSLNRVEQLCDEVSRRPAKFAQYYSDKWAGMLSHEIYSNFFDQSVRNDLITCSILPHDENGKNSFMLLSKPCTPYNTSIKVGKYENTLKHLNLREQNIIVDDMDVIQTQFNAEEYCWSF